MPGPRAGNQHSVSSIFVELLEREGALSELNALLGEARDGSGAVALMYGEAGIGKTSLVRAFVDHNSDKAFVLTAGCDDLFTARPLGPVWDMAEDEPSLREALDADDRDGVFRSLLDLLTRSLRPTIAVIEDIHWADEASLDLIRFVGRRIEATHALLILTYRDEPAFMEDLDGTLADLPHGRVTRVPLEPLSLEAVKMLAGDGLDAAAIWDASGGNPLFVTELITRDGARIPASVVAASRARVSRLSRVGRDLVELASVVPGRVNMTLIEEIDPGLMDGVYEAERVGMVEVVGEALTFRHELVREAVEANLPGSRRTMLNRAVLEVLEQGGSDLSRLAHHALEAADPEAILRILPQAARAAADFGSDSEAVSLLRALKPLVPQMPIDEQADYYDLLAQEEHWISGSGEDAIQRSIDIRRDIGDPEPLGRSLLFGIWLAHLANDRATANERAKEGIAVLTPIGGEPLAMAYAQEARLAMYGSDHEHATELAELALASADKTSAARASALNTLGMVRAATAYPAGMELLEESHRIGETVGSATESGRAAINAVKMALEWRDLSTAEQWIARAWDGPEAAELGQHEFSVRFGRGELAALRCNWQEAEREARVVSNHPKTLENYRTRARILLARVLTRTGSLEIEADLRRAWESARTTGEPQHTFRAGAVIAEHRYLCGVSDDETFDEVLLEFRRCQDLANPWHVGELALWLWLGGDIPSIPDNAPDVLRALGRGEWERAARWFAHRDDRYEQAIALSLGDDDARRRAIQILEGVEADPFGDRLRAELRAEGVQVPGRLARATRQSPHGLTARQTEVLELLRSELSNADIGRRLSISERTVEHHVSAILTRLGVSSRTEAVEAATEPT